MLSADKISRDLLIAIVVVFLSTCLCLGQVTNVTDTTSTPIPGAGHDYIKMLSETVNPSNGSLSLRIQVPIPKGRGLTLPFSFAYDSTAGNSVTSQRGIGGFQGSTTFLSNGNWSYSVPQVTYGKALIYVTISQISCYGYTDYLFHDPLATAHALGLAGVEYIADYCPRQNVSIDSGGDAMVRASLLQTGDGMSDSVEVADADGVSYSFAITAPHQVGSFYAALPVSVEDRNGNAIWITDNNNGAFTVTDTLGRTVLTSTGFGSTGNQVTVSGLPGPYVVNWTTSPMTVAPNAQVPNGMPSSQYCFGIPGGPTSESVIHSIVLPNDQTYTFGYDPNTGMINEIDYPTGGKVTYTWGYNSQSAFASFPDQKGNLGACTYTYDTPAITDRYVYFDGSTLALHQHFTYSTTWNYPATTWASKSTTVTTYDLIRGGSFTTTYYYTSVPASGGPYDVVTFAPQVAVESEVDYHNWDGSLLRTTNKTWQDMFRMTCESNTEEGSTSRVDYTYGPGAQVTDKKDWDWGQAPACGSAASGTPLQETVTNYASFGFTPAYLQVYWPNGAPIYDRPSTVTVYENGTQKSLATYGYDETSLVSGGVTGMEHDAAYSTSMTVRGNATTKTDWLNAGGSSPAWHYAYDDTGQVVSMTDPNSNPPTTYSYDHDNAYVSQITHPTTNGIAHIRNFTHNSADGLLTSSTDENNRVTQYNYGENGELLDRLTSIADPDDGGVTYSYAGACAQPTNTSTVVGGGVSNLTTSVSLDGVCHVTQTAITSDTQGHDYTDTTYDGLGHVRTVSNPYRSTSDPSYGLTTTAYDALGRPRTVTNPDSTQAVTSYTGTCTA